MSFAFLSLGGVAAGLLTLAGALFVLQRLRVRHRRQQVISTLFWRQALEESRARQLFERFRHPLVYLLLLAICGLLWLAAAAPQREPGGAAEHLVLVDGSSGDREVVAAAVEAAADLARRLPLEHRTVLLCSGWTRPLLLPGEAVRTLDARFEATRLVASASSVVEAALAAGTAPVSGRRRLITVVGETPVPMAISSQLPPGCDIRRLEVGRAQAVEGPRLRELGVTRARSGRPDCVDVLLVISGDLPAEALRWSWEGAAIDGAVLQVAPTARASGDPAWIARDLSARGGVLRIESLTPVRGLPAERVLPDLRPVRVRVSPSVRAWLAPLIDADPGLVEAAESADVECRSSASSQGIAADSGGMPLLAITARPRALVTISAPAGEASRLARLISELGIERGLTSELAEAAVPLVAIEAPPTPTDRRVRIWEALLDDRADLVHSRAFPLLLASSLRWLAGRGEYAPRVAVREALAESIPAAASARVAPEGSCCDPVGRPYVPLVAGVHGDAHGGAVAAALLDSRPTWPEGGPAGVRFAASAADLGGMVDLRIPLALLALALLLVEWLLVRSGRIP